MCKACEAGEAASFIASFPEEQQARIREMVSLPTMEERIAALFDMYGATIDQIAARQMDRARPLAEAATVILEQNNGDVAKTFTLITGIAMKAIYASPDLDLDLLALFFAGLITYMAKQNYDIANPVTI